MSTRSNRLPGIKRQHLLAMRFTAGLMLGLLCMYPLTAAEAVFLPFGIFENGGGIDVTPLDLWVDVLDHGANTVDFVFGNDSELSSCVTDVYFERTDLWESLLYDPLIINSYGVVFMEDAHPSNPPGSIADHGGPWGGVLFSAQAIPPPIDHGINNGVGETLTIRFGYDGEFATLVSALSYPGGLRIVEKIQGVGDGGEDSVWGVTPVPEPATSLFLVSALILASGSRFIRRRSKS